MSGVTMELLREELATFEKSKPALLGSDEGRWALIHQGRVIGVFDTEGDAIAAGYRELGNVPFLTKQIVPTEVPFSFVSNHLAV
jgi:hypothetical protein